LQSEPCLRIVAAYSFRRTPDATGSGQPHYRRAYDPNGPGAAGSTAAISREHAVLTEFGNLISIVGGKWTAYRRMAADAMAAAHRAGLIQARPVHTERLALVVDRVLADDSARRAAPDAAFAEHCRRYAQARTRRSPRPQPRCARQDRP
jgi:glycerol-3-phosphate dehydrogenase